MVQLGIELGPTSYSGQPQRLRGEVMTIRAYRHEDLDWIVCTVRTRGREQCRLVGDTVATPRVGQVVDAVGVWESHPEFGDQFRCTYLTATQPTGENAIVRFIVANIPGCGDKKARRIVARLGPKALDILMHEPERVREALPGALPSIIEAWAAWAEGARCDSVAYRLHLHFTTLGISDRIARRIVRFFRSPDVAEIIALRYPYRLLRVPGMGWRRADEIAQKLGVPADAEQRLDAATVFAVESGRKAGHTCLPVEEVGRRVQTLLGSARMDAVRQSVARCQERGELRIYDDLLYLPADLDREYRIADRLRGLSRRAWPLPDLSGSTVHGILDRAQLSSPQRAAVCMALEAGCAVLTGLPGSGKTTTLKAIVEVFTALGRRVLLLAPTGKAAARASAVTGVGASTVHRALKSTPGIVPAEPLDADVVVIDECGMLSCENADWLLSAIDPSATQVLFVGDENQLPSVEHGRVLGDIVASGTVPVARLTEVFRQGADSGIITLARDIVDARMPERGMAQVDLTPVRPAELELAVLDSLDNLIKEFGVDGVSLLVPMRSQRFGMIDLNRQLQPILNPNGAIGPHIGGAARVRVGDRVIQTKNTYDLRTPVMNGETGTVLAVDNLANAVRVDWGDREVVHDGVHLIRLELAWAITIHRSQGSEYPAVLAVLPDCAGRMLNRQLLYTAVTRASERLTVIHSAGALERAVSTNGARRHTGLASILREAAR
jgi:exodeoxyribonuclease V alpha subunit